jgi:hypothetical protein
MPEFAILITSRTDSDGVVAKALGETEVNLIEAGGFVAAIPICSTVHPGNAVNPSAKAPTAVRKFSL